MTTLRFRDHEEFHRAALHMAIAGAVAGLAAHLAGLVFAGVGGMTAPLPLAVLVAAAGFGAARPRDRRRVDELAPIALLAGAAAFSLALASTLGVDRSLGALAFALAFAALLARGTTGRRLAAGVVVGGAAGLAALHVVSTFVAELPAPAWVAAAGGGAGFAVVGALGLVPRYLDLDRDPIAATWARCRHAFGGEHRELAERGVAVWRWGNESLAADSPVRGAIEGAVLRLLETAERWQSVEASVRGAEDLQAVDARLDELDHKIASTADPVARGQYQQARRALEEQRRYVQEIASVRERALARMHHYVAAVERFRFAAANHRSADALRVSTDDVQPILDDLDALGGDIDCASEALGEAEHLLEVGPPGPVTECRRSRP